ncbi:ABC transporter ATP-binding protein [Chryseomicrobium aureum]|uniref:ABC transporter ATP-binding protein n=1 Tax=Chryseomicrobium aureum TaxID=1441723 RepID=UPI001959FB63|nr:ABC transporter ATP-binding protein [Chryseomicrobium aureum]MBM7707143.1 ATP-binding cassette subfamily B protein AbcA/BmrA [Chryseomicrobium aureum]
MKMKSLVDGMRWPKWMIAFAFLFSLVETGFGLVIPLLTMNFIDSFTEGGISPLLLGGVALLLIVQAVLSGIAFYLMRKIGEYVVAYIRNRVWRHVLGLPVGFFDNEESGELMSRILQDTSVIKSLITDHLITFFTSILTVIGAVGILLWIDWRMTLILLVSVPVTLAVMFPIGRVMSKVAKSTQDEVATFSAQLGRVLQNIRLVKYSQSEARERIHGEQQVDRIYKFYLKEAKLVSILSPVMTLIMTLVLIVVFGYGGAQVASGALSAGALVAIIFYLIQIIVPFTQMASFFTAYQKTVGATERIQDILERAQENAEGKSLPSTEQDVVLHDVTFAYGEKVILEDISLSIPRGKVTAFVGESGGGKTTMFSMLQRFYEPKHGGINYGDTDIREIKLAEWRGLFGYVSQESPLMNGTIRDNILYGVEQVPTDTAIEQALRQANAWEFIMKLEQGLETPVGEGGIKLSGGQRQRIAIARAVLRNPRILLLDEATSSLDTESERLVQEALQTVMRGRTTLVIAHRLSTVQHADQLVILRDKQIQGVGTHHHLVETNTYYQELVKNAQLLT